MFVELVGPGGVGKTTVARLLAESGEFEVLFVSERRRLKPRVAAAWTALDLARRHRLSLRETLSLFRKCSSVEQGMDALDDPRSRLVILDEGPLRTLRDTRCSSFAERRAWWSYARSVLERLAKRRARFVVIHLDLDETTRRERFFARSPAAVGPARPIPTIRFGVRVLSARILGPALTECRATIDWENTDTAQVAGRVANFIERTRLQSG